MDTASIDRDRRFLTLRYNVQHHVLSDTATPFPREIADSLSPRTVELASQKAYGTMKDCVRESVLRTMKTAGDAEEFCRVFNFPHSALGPLELPSGSRKQSGVTRSSVSGSSTGGTQRLGRLATHLTPELAAGEKVFVLPLPLEFAERDPDDPTQILHNGKPDVDAGTSSYRFLSISLSLSVSL